MSQQERHLTIEQLSALLDSRLSPQEQSTCQAHLDTCETCQQELATLRQTVTLLHALPEVKLPRSFVLPTDSNLLSASNTDGEPDRPIELAQYRPRHRRWRTTLRLASALAAVVGILFMLSSLFTLLPSMNSAMTNSTFTAGSSAQPHVVASNDQQTQATAIASGQLSTAMATSQATSIQHAATNRQAQNGGQAMGTLRPTAGDPQPFPTLLFFNLSTPVGRFGLGLLLLLLGLMGVTLFNLRTRRKIS